MLSLKFVYCIQHCLALEVFSCFNLIIGIKCSFNNLEISFFVGNL